MSAVQVRNWMNEMKLVGMAQSLERLVGEATKDAWSYTEFLDALLQAESDSRDKRRAQSRIKAAKLRQAPAFEDMDFTANRSITKAQVKEIYSLKWIEQGRAVLLVGQTGVGKTFIAQAAGLHACGSGKNVLFLSVSTLLEQQQLARSSGTYLKYRDKLTRPDVLILDDFGMRKFTALEAQDLCDLLEERSMGKSTVITTQLPPEHWPEVLPDPVIADAILDRVIHSALQLRITGESYRKVKAKKLESAAAQK